MKTLKLILSAAAIAVFTACGSSGNANESFDFQKAVEMAKPENGKYVTEKEWSKRADMYEKYCDFEISRLNELLAKAQPGMTIEEQTAIKRGEYGDEYYAAASVMTSFYDKISVMHKGGGDRITDETINRFKTAKQNFKTTETELRRQINEIVNSGQTEIQIPDVIEITPSGIGNIVLGMDHNKIPSKVDGFYKRHDFKYFNHEGDDADVPLEYKGYYVFTNDFYASEPILYATVNNSGRIASINVVSPDYVSPDGIRVGMSIDELTADSRFRPSENEVNDNWRSDNFFYQNDGMEVTGIIIGEEY